MRTPGDHTIDLIIRGHRGHGMFERWLPEFISQAVIVYVDRAVMVVP